jgi:hypothetical protein
MLSATDFGFSLEQKKSLQAPGSFRSQKHFSRIIHRCEYLCCHRIEINFLCRQEGINTLLSNPFPMRTTGAGVILCYKCKGCIWCSHTDYHSLANRNDYCSRKGRWLIWGYHITCVWSRQGKWGPHAFVLHVTHSVLYCVSDLSSDFKGWRKINSCSIVYSTSPTARKGVGW